MVLDYSGTSLVIHGRWLLTGSFTNSNLTDRGTNQDFGWVVAYGRWLLMGSFTNSNLTDRKQLGFWLGGRLREVVAYDWWSLREVPLY